MPCWYLYGTSSPGSMLRLPKPYSSPFDPREPMHHRLSHLSIGPTSPGWLTLAHSWVWIIWQRGALVATPSHRWGKQRKASQISFAASTLFATGQMTCLPCIRIARFEEWFYCLQLLESLPWRIWLMVRLMCVIYPVSPVSRIWILL